MIVQEWIGFIITIGAFLFLIYFHLFGGKKKDPEQEKRLKEFLEGLKADMGGTSRPMPTGKQVERKQPPVPPQPKLQPVKRAVAAPSSAHTIAKRRIPKGKQMVIYREIIDQPRAYRPWTMQHF